MTSVTLAAHRYGKSRVRVMKVLRDGETHAIKELTTRVLLEGDFARSFTAAENALVVATDTMKNTINVLAHEHLGHENEPFARRVADHFLDRYGHVSHVTVDLVERVWTRLAVAGAPGERRDDRQEHPHSFAQVEVAKPFTRLTAGRGAARLDSGVRDLVILKSTGSGFEDFHRDDLTTLRETRERILATALRATWRWGREPASYRDCHRAILDAMLVPFARRYSPSVQATLFEMASAALDACPEIDRVTLAMPNLHCLPVDLTPFGRTNRHELFVPTDEPHGTIEATIVRGGGK